MAEDHAHDLLVLLVDRPVEGGVVAGVADVDVDVSVVEKQAHHLRGSKIESESGNKKESESNNGPVVHVNVVHLDQVLEDPGRPALGHLAKAPALVHQQKR